MDMDTQNYITEPKNIPGLSQDGDPITCGLLFPQNTRRQVQETLLETYKCENKAKQATNTSKCS